LILISEAVLFNFLGFLRCEKA